MNKRIVQLNKAFYVDGPIVYWMVRDQRVADNPALWWAATLAQKYHQPLIVMVCLRRDLRPANMTARSLDFMLTGLKEVAKRLREINVAFTVQVGEPAVKVSEFIKNMEAGALVTDFSPLRTVRNWHSNLQNNLTVPFYMVDAHNIVPVLECSNKAEYAAQFYRKKIMPRLTTSLAENFNVRGNFKTFALPVVDWYGLQAQVLVNEKVQPIEGVASGELAAVRELRAFINNRLPIYATKRNDPNENAQSNLSPYLHFGQLSARMVARAVLASDASRDNIDAFIDELVVWRELAENYCYYNKNYDNLKGAPMWARNTLQAHQKDKRDYIYTLAQFDQADTHDKLWNAAQQQMKQTGKMHGYMRMYWAKKILEWTNSASEAIKIAIYLNDTYSLDGRDPNGYAGIMWAIAGVHDRPWFDRPIYGTIRYMNANGCRSKFDVDKYIKTYAHN